VFTELNNKAAAISSRLITPVFFELLQTYCKLPLTCNQEEIAKLKLFHSRMQIYRLNLNFKMSTNAPVDNVK